MPATESLRSAWVYQPCDELGGDILNIFALDEHTVGFYLLDVSGHGVAASLMSVAASRLLQPLETENSLVRRREGPRKPWKVTPPADVAVALNQRFAFDVSIQQYFTILYGVIDLQTFQARIVSAGHPGPVHSRRGQPARMIEVEGLPIGFNETAAYDEVVLQMSPGDRLYLHSDGVTEAMNGDSELFGSERLLGEINRVHGLPLAESVKAISIAADVWSKHDLKDDVSILALELIEP
ncbi:MAG: PP2C family protein-serine/threonine phosphatase [Planctomycetota bacterium]|nr:PP2C family protein-serine/threonine phosphatase [Planctomycetota bacterium]